MSPWVHHSSAFTYYMQYIVCVNLATVNKQLVLSEISRTFGRNSLCGSAPKRRNHDDGTAHRQPPD